MGTASSSFSGLNPNYELGFLPTWSGTEIVIEDIVAFRAFQHLTVEKRKSHGSLSNLNSDASAS